MPILKRRCFDCDELFSTGWKAPEDLAAQDGQTTLIETPRFRKLDGLPTRCPMCHAIYLAKQEIKQNEENQIMPTMPQ